MHFTGVEAHAAEFPWEGVNALDAAILCYNNVSCMRQQLPPGWMLHGLFIQFIQTDEEVYTKFKVFSVFTNLYILSVYKVSNFFSVDKVSSIL